MHKPQNEAYESQLHLDAMLYVLEDPALDRDAFEAQLEDNCQLAEILSNAVAMQQLSRSVSWVDRPTLPALRPSSASISDRVLRMIATFSALAAAVLIAVFIGSTAFQNRNPGSTEFGSNVVLAWGDMQSEHLALQLGRDLTEFDLEGNLSVASLTMPNSGGTNSSVEGDVPEWLVLATSDSLELGFDLREGKGLLQ